MPLAGWIRDNELAFAILLLAFAVRLYHVDAPIADRHSWNQCSSVLIARSLVDGGFDPRAAHKFVIEGEDEAPAPEAQEFPLYYGLLAVLFAIFGDGHWPGHALSIAISMVGLVYFHRLARLYFDERLADLALFVFALSPLYLFFSRAVQPDTLMITAVIAAIYHGERWLGDEPAGPSWPCLAWLFVGTLGRPSTPFFVVLPLAYLVVRRWGVRGLVRREALAVAVVGIALPIALTLLHAKLVMGVFFQHGHLLGRDLAPWSLEYWSRMQHRLLDSGITPLVSIFFVVGLFSKTLRERKTLVFWLAGVLVFFLAVRSGNFHHNYYQLGFVPVAVLLAVAGLEVAGRRWLGSARARHVAVGVFVVLYAANAGVYASKHFRLDLSSWRAGELAAEVTDPDDRLVVVDPGASRFHQVLCAADRVGWIVPELSSVDELEGLVDRGADALVLVLEEEQRAARRDLLAAVDARHRVVAQEEGPLGKKGLRHDLAVYELR